VLDARLKIRENLARHNKLVLGTVQMNVGTNGAETAMGTQGDWGASFVFTFQAPPVTLHASPLRDEVASV
jgi:hypothetical protein